MLLKFLLLTPPTVIYTHPCLYMRHYLLLVQAPRYQEVVRPSGAVSPPPWMTVKLGN